MSLKKFRKGRPELPMQQLLRDHHEEEAALNQEFWEMLADLEDWPGDMKDGPTYPEGESLYDLCYEPEDYGDPFYFGRKQEELVDYDYM